MVQESRAALDGVAALLFVVYVPSTAVSLLLAVKKHPKLVLLTFVCIVRLVTAGVQINLDTASWQRRAAWLALIEAGYPVITQVLIFGTSISTLAATGRLMDRFWHIGFAVLCGLLAIGFRVAGAVDIGKAHEEPTRFQTIYLVGEGFNHVAMLTVLLGFAPLPRLLARRRGGYAHTIPHQSRGKIWTSFLNRGLSREQIIAKYQDPHYLTWYFCSLALTPLLIARHVYSALCTYLPQENRLDYPFYPLAPNIGALAGLCYVPEMLIIVALLVVGWKMPDEPYIAAIRQKRSYTSSHADTSIEMQPIDT